ncbi:hypothetical protein [Acetobacter fabarum]|uniref:hypothetical protein n=1 Tax=Acetobacter fabarum TaxID=483199 RepID=UPI0020A11A18|nr:hypothetical protein [Acetobacter fabarum]MCP1227774.1 hypothetical protein [Acetobacter fabarum]MCP1233269.1 hypothetical protein [Acetobacter fabarum]
MIVKESRIKTRSGAGALSRHVLHGAKNEAIRVLAGSDWLMRDAMREARREGLTYGLRHIAFNPDDTMTDDQLSDFARRLCEELHADPEHLTLVVHQKDGSTHGHLILPEWQGNHVLESRFTWMRLEKVARLEEIRLGHALVPGRHDRAIAKALRREGHHQAAEQVAALIPAPESTKPRAAYTSQARRMTERQGLDLPTMKKLVSALWSQSDGVKSFRAALAEHGLTMREGDRKDTRPGAHIIVKNDGTLIGSFTRLTKVKIAYFRQLLTEERSSQNEKTALDIRSTRVPVHMTSEKDRTEILSAADTSLVSNRSPKRIRLPRRNPMLEELKRRQMENVDSPVTLQLFPPKPLYPLILSAEEARFRRQIRQAIQDQQIILDQRAPESDWTPLDRETTIARWRENFAPYQKQLRNSFTRYRHAKKEWKQATESQWQRMTGRAGKLEKICQQLLLEFLEVLRFVLQALLHVVGLRSTPPEPVRPVLTENDKPVLESFRKQYDAEFTAMTDPEKLKTWLNYRFDRLMQVRQKRIRQWDKAHQSEKEQARQEIARLSSRLASPIPRIRTQTPVPSSSGYAPSLG